ncbi:MAG: hypothetical protein CVU56_28665, partial [Deltaproteobacteria bacterium HGW-Deltaproteobacteria-14]
VAGGGGRLPHLDRIQAAFGAHDVSGVQAHVGGAARAASEAIGAEAYATGSHVAFRGAPDLHTAAHEAAHIVQQRAGVSLSGGVGQVGDRYERHADAVADLVVQGKSAEALLGGGAAGGGGEALQRITGPEGPATTPALADGAVVQREGSGEHGQKAASGTDYALKVAWQAAGVFAALSLPNAAANLRHYLGNTGDTRAIDIFAIFGSDPTFRAKVEGEMDALARPIAMQAAKSGKPVKFASGRKNHYFTTEESKDWYFAVGGCHYFIVGEASYDASRKRIVVSATITLKDRYNWDGGKSVDIAGVKVTDELMGRLHKAGVAKEFDFVAKGRHGIAFAHDATPKNTAQPTA